MVLFICRDLCLNPVWREFLTWFLSWDAMWIVEHYMNRPGPFKTLADQLYLPVVNLNQILDTSQEKLKQAGCICPQFGAIALHIVLSKTSRHLKMSLFFPFFICCFFKLYIIVVFLTYCWFSYSCWCRLIPSISIARSDQSVPLCRWKINSFEASQCSLLPVNVYETTYLILVQFDSLLRTGFYQR